MSNNTNCPNKGPVPEPVVGVEEVEYETWGDIMEEDLEEDLEESYTEEEILDELDFDELDEDTDD